MHMMQKIGGMIMNTRQLPPGNANLLGERIAALRKARNISQKDFVARLQVEGCDITQTGVSKLECRRRQINAHELRAIAAVLGVDMNTLFALD